MRNIRSLVWTVLALVSFTTAFRAKEVSIPDPSLNAAIRETLQKPSGPLTEQDLLSLINLRAPSSIQWFVLVFFRVDPCLSAVKVPDSSGG